MQTLTRNVGRREPSGTQLPTPFTTFTYLGVQIRQGELTLVAGQPGVGKSSLALALALHSNVPTLYVCADTSELTMRVRTLAMLSGEAQAICEDRMYHDTAWAQGVFNQTQHVSWSFDTTPSLDTIDEELAAYEEVFGLPPQLIIIDNLMDVMSDNGDEWGGMRATMKHLKELARKSTAAVVVLHHTSEAVKTEGYGPPRSAIQGKVSALPAVVLTLDSTGPGRMGVAVVKNRFGQADSGGTHGAYLNWNPAAMQLTDIPSQQPMKESRWGDMGF